MGSPESCRQRGAVRSGWAIAVPCLRCGLAWERLQLVVKLANGPRNWTPLEFALQKQ